jgi:hypothetical protein
LSNGEVGEAGHINKAWNAEIRKSIGGYLVKGIPVDVYKDLFTHESGESLKKAIDWAVNSRIFPNCGTRTLDNEFEVKEFCDKKASQYFSRSWTSGQSGLPDTLLFFPVNSEEGLEFSLIGKKPCRFKSPSPLENIRVIEDAWLGKKLPCCGSSGGVIIKSKRGKRGHENTKVYQSVSFSHVIVTVTPEIAAQMKLFLGQHEWISTPAQLQKREKEFVGLVCVSGAHENGNMDYAALWRDLEADTKGILIFEPLISTGKLEAGSDPDKVEPIMTRINKGSINSAPAFIRLTQALESVKEQAADFVYTTHTLDTLGVE